VLKMAGECNVQVQVGASHVQQLARRKKAQLKHPGMGRRLLLGMGGGGSVAWSGVGGDLNVRHNVTVQRCTGRASSIESSQGLWPAHHTVLSALQCALARLGSC